MRGGLVNVKIGRIQQCRAEDWPYFMVGQLTFDRQGDPETHIVRFPRGMNMRMPDMHAAGAMAIMAHAFRLVNPMDARPLLPETRIGTIAEAMELAL